MFPVNCSYLNLWFLSFVPPIPLSILDQGDWEGKEGGNEWQVVSVGTINWRISPLNYDNEKKEDRRKYEQLSIWTLDYKDW